MRLDEFFPYQVCINLDTRLDRWQRVSARFLEHGLSRVRRFPAVNGNQEKIPPIWQHSPGAYGCLRSHLAVIEQARDAARPSVLIFEDDAVLAPEFSAKFADYVRQLPEDWDMVLFGGIHAEPLNRVGRNVMKITHSLSTYAYALNHTIYDDFIQVNRQSLTVLDESTRALQKRFNCYCFMPHLAWVEEDYSDVQGERSNLWWLKESLVLFGPRIDEILKNTVAIISYDSHKPGAFRNLRFTLDYFAALLPTVTTMIFGGEPGLRQGDLPAGCVLESGAKGRGRDQSRILERVFDRFSPGKEFFIFLDSDVFLTREDIRANLLKCQDYEVASSFCEIYDLREGDTRRILNGDFRWNYDPAYPVRQKAGLYDSACIMTGKGLRRLRGWKKPDGQNDERVALQREAGLRIYDSPNLARRLASG